MDRVFLWIGIGITYTVLGLGLAWKARLRGSLLLDAGPLQEPVLSGNPLAYIPLAILLAIAWFQSKSGGYPFVGAVMAVVGILAFVVVMKKWVHLRFTDQGVCLLGIIRWSDVRSHRWVEGPEGIVGLELHVSRKKRNYTAGLAISAIYRERIEGILAAHVPRGSSGA